MYLHNRCPAQALAGGLDDCPSRPAKIVVATGRTNCRSSRTFRCRKTPASGVPEKVSSTNSVSSVVICTRRSTSALSSLIMTTSRSRVSTRASSVTTGFRRSTISALPGRKVYGENALFSTGVNRPAGAIVAQTNRWRCVRVIRTVGPTTGGRARCGRCTIAQLPAPAAMVGSCGMVGTPTAKVSRPPG